MIVFTVIASGLYLLYVLFLTYGRLSIRLGNENGPHADRISVVIPFRNEAERLPHLVASLSRLKTMPLEILFVNDHSEDSFEELLDLPELPVCVLHVPSGEAGKKAALTRGIAVAKGEYILTWDADITVTPNYFETLSTNGKADLYVLPVRVHAENLQGRFWEFEHFFLQLVNRACASLYRPILASGANLLFRKDTFLAVSRPELHGRFSSGDDQFLLQDMRAAGKKVVLCDGPAVDTAAPGSWKAAIAQHLRWIGKNQAQHDAFANFCGASGLLAAFIPTMLSILTWQSPVFWCVIATKCALEWTVFFNSKKIGTTLAAPIFLTVYPFIGLWIYILSFFRTPRWKGRLTNVDRIR